MHCFSDGYGTSRPILLKILGQLTCRHRRRRRLLRTDGARSGSALQRRTLVLGMDKFGDSRRLRRSRFLSSHFVGPSFSGGHFCVSARRCSGRNSPVARGSLPWFVLCLERPAAKQDGAAAVVD